MGPLERPFTSSPEKTHRKTQPQSSLRNSKANFGGISAAGHIQQPATRRSGFLGFQEDTTLLTQLNGTVIISPIELPKAQSPLDNFTKHHTHRNVA